MGTELFNSIVAKVASHIPMFAKALVELGLERIGANPWTATPTQMKRALDEYVIPRLQRFSRGSGEAEGIMGGGVVWANDENQVVAVTPGVAHYVSRERRLDASDPTLFDKLRAVGLVIDIDELVGLGRPQLSRRIEIHKPHRSVLDVTFILTRDAAGAPTGVISSIRDITLTEALVSETASLYEKLESSVAELHAQHEKVQTAYAKLRETQQQLIQAAKLTALGEMAAGVAHELNQPLNGIKLIMQGALRELKRGDYDADRLPRDGAEVVDLVNKMASIIDHMRAFARKPDPERRGQVDVHATINGALSLIREQLRVHNIEIETEFAADLPPTAGDLNSLEQVFINLLTNARDAIFTRMEQEGRRGGRITIRSALRDGNEVCVDVEDDGVGVAPAIQDKVFDAFFTTKVVGKGTGLGLSIAQGIVSEYGGRMELDATADSGTIFRVLLPVWASS